MLGRADFERFFSVARVVIVVVAILLVSIAIAKAQDHPTIPSLPDKQKVMMVPLLVPCTNDEELIIQALDGMTRVFTGILNNQFQYELFVEDGGKFTMMMQKAGKPGVCFVAAGEDHQLLNIHPEEEESGL